MNILFISPGIKSTIESLNQLLQLVHDAHVHDDHRKRKTNSGFDKGVSANHHMIKDQKEFACFEFERFKPDLVIIVPELLWEGRGVDEGYDIAYDMLTGKLKNHFFQLIFVSVLERKQLLRLAGEKNAGLIRAFPHYCLLNNGSHPPVLQQYSEVHFHMIKSLVISDLGRINVLEHDLSNIKNNLSQSTEPSETEQLQYRLQKQLDELTILSAWTNRHLQGIGKKLDAANATKELLTETANALENALLEIKQTLRQASETGTPSKTDLRVLIIEDAEADRRFFSRVFSMFYRQVEPDASDEIITKSNKRKAYDICNAPEIIKQQAKDFQIIVIDLLFKDEDDCWLPFNGLDLLLLAKKFNPHAVVRLITSLPREIVARVAAATLNIPIPISHLFSKKVGYEALKYTIADRVAEINMEHSEKMRSKQAHKPVPKTGIFSWPPAPYLIMQYMEKENGYYEKCRDISNGLFGNYLRNNLKKNTEGWNDGKLISNQKKNSFEESDFRQILPNLLVHRLMAIDYALTKTQFDFNSSHKHDQFAVNYEDYAVIMSSATNFSTCNKAYFHKIGFNGKDKDNEFFLLSFSNLFPEEINYVAETVKELDNQSMLADYQHLKNWFVNKVLCNMGVYENWDEITDKFDPYGNKDQIDNTGVIAPECLKPDLPASLLQWFLQGLIASQQEPFAKQIIEAIEGDDCPDEDAIAQMQGIPDVWFLYDKLAEIDTFIE
jgi:hypothetical protein